MMTERQEQTRWDRLVTSDYLRILMETISWEYNLYYSSSETPFQPYPLYQDLSIKYTAELCYSWSVIMEAISGPPS